MTKIVGHKDDDLLQKKGYRGHPTLAFLDTNGEVIARPLDRTVASFRATLAAIGDYAALKKRAATGEKHLEYDFFVLEHKLSKIRGQALVDRGRSLRGLEPKQQLYVNQILLGVEVSDLVIASLGGSEAVAKAGKRMRQILESGQYPDLERSANALSVLSRYGEQIEDAALLERCAACLRKSFGDDQRMLDWAGSLEKKAVAIRSKLESTATKATRLS